MDNATAIAGALGIVGSIVTFVLEFFYYPLGYRHLLWSALGGLALGATTGGVNIILLTARGSVPSAANLAAILGTHVFGAFGMLMPCIIMVNCVFDSGPVHEVVAAVVKVNNPAPRFEVEPDQAYAGLTFVHPDTFVPFSGKHLSRGDRRKFTVHPGRLGLPWASAWQDIGRRP